MGAMQQALLMTTPSVVGGFASGPQVNSDSNVFYGIGDSVAYVVVQPDGLVYDADGFGNNSSSPSYYYQPLTANIGTNVWVRAVITSEFQVFPPTGERQGTYDTWLQIGAGRSFGVSRSATANGNSSITGYLEFSLTSGGTIVAQVPFVLTATIEI